MLNSVCLTTHTNQGGLYGSEQKIKERNETNTIVTLDLIPNYELESLLLSYGDKLKVLEPVSLKNKIADRVKNLYKNYWKK